ncbi:hypothetical protein Patl1_25886 [Pistacia atlantica]|uniref:Uncharacterized protein n=1 Tax=Pistacia atlantica TaxID=434234 RepID=A0ACC1B132_9ROSI|nr:hypothetical protein Patl1_25886 [Pistacia atlantica]
MQSSSLHLFNSPSSKPSPRHFPKFTCKVLINPSKITLPLKLPQSPPVPPLYPSPPDPTEPLFSPTKHNFPLHLNPLQKLAASALDKIEDSVIGFFDKAKTLPKRVDPTVQISGNFAPVQECLVQHRLKVVGQIPSCLRGVYVRNGANPMHLFDGDGMIHAVTFGLENQLHGHLGLARLALFMARAGVGLVDGSRGMGVANAGLVYFNGRLLAMSEDDLPYQVKIKADGDLETIGRFNFDNQLDCPMIAHPKVDPVTGDLHTLSYNVVRKPYLKYFRFDNKSGKKSRDVDITLDQPTMIHDFAITENCVVILDHQEKSSNGDKIIVIIGSCMNPPDSVFNEYEEPVRSELTEIRLNLTTGESTRRVIVSGMNLEAGQVKKQQLGEKTRFVYLAIAEPWPKCSGIAKVDLESGEVRKFMYGLSRFGGEPYYVAEENNESEGEGYIMSFVRDERREKSELVIVKASSMKEVSSVKLPSRVPYGFHGTFVSENELNGQAL